MLHEGYFSFLFLCCNRIVFRRSATVDLHVALPPRLAAVVAGDVDIAEHTGNAPARVGVGATEAYRVVPICDPATKDVGRRRTSSSLKYDRGGAGFLDVYRIAVRMQRFWTGQYITSARI